MEVYEISTPVLVACNKGLNTPRYAPLPGIMRAKKSLWLNIPSVMWGSQILTNAFAIQNSSFPPEKPPGKKFDATEEATQAEVVKEVVALLRNNAKII